jgi:hypothetical protein
MEGEIPAFLGDLTDLYVLRIDQNNFTGTIPPSLGKLTGLNTLGLSFNDLEGPIPPELASIPTLYYVVLSENRLTGPIPHEFGTATDLGLLDLSHNQLEGSIPADLGNLPNLWKLELQSNRLTGPIPPELGNLTALTGLYLQDNELEGLLPLAVAENGGRIQNLNGENRCIMVPPGNDGLYAPDTEAYRSMRNPSGLPICGLVLTTNTETVSVDLGAHVEELVENEALNLGQGNALGVKLDGAIAQAEKGQYKAAANMVRAFMNQVTDLVATGVLAAEEAAPLFERAEILREMWLNM